MRALFERHIGGIERSRRWKAIARSCALSAAACCAATAAAQNYPTKPIRFIVTYAPGGGADVLLRIVAQKLTESMGQQIVVDNRGGAGGFLGMEAASKAPPDGYTLLLGVAAYLTVNPSTFKKLPYDPVKDYAPITLMGSSCYILVVHPSVPVKTAKELISYAKANPAKLNYGSSPLGSGNHLAGELFKSMADVQITHIPYKGAGFALTALISGEVQVLFGSMLTTLPHINSGKLRALALTGNRSQAAPDLPAISETVPGYYVDVWFAAFAPAGTPAGIIKRLNGEIGKVLKTEEIRQRFQTEGFEPQTSTPQELANLIKEETAKWAKLVKSANIRAE